MLTGREDLFDDRKIMQGTLKLSVAVVEECNFNEYKNNNEYPVIRGINREKESKPRESS